MIRSLRHFLLASLSIGIVPLAASAQDPVTPDSVQQDSLARAAAARDSALTPADPTAPSNCTLEFEPIAPDTRSLSQRDAGEAYITYVSGRMLWTCGNATMEADSAVKYDVGRRVNLFGDIVYRDSIRTLTSELLTYYEIQDLVVAERSVELVRTTDNSTLTGPHVEFLRAVSGVNEVTTATGRPHMRFYPESEDSTAVEEPFEIDADRALFAGESEARMFGDVKILRSDLSAEADSAVLTRDDGVGTLWGDPWVESEQVRLEGDTIRFVSEEEELREVHALGNGFARGEQFEVRSDLIDIELRAREVEQVWAYGEGIAEALSGDHRLFGDSLRFKLVESQLDTVFSVGEAIAIQGADGEPPPELSVRPDSVVADSGMVSDSAEVGEPEAPADTAAAPPEVVPQEVAADSTTRELMAAILEDVRVTGRDSTGQATGEAPAEGSDDPGGGSASSGPVLPIDGSANWVRGDTLIAVFEREGREARADSAAAALADSLGLDPGAEAAARAIADSLGVDVDSLAAAVDPAAIDSALARADTLAAVLDPTGQARTEAEAALAAAADATEGPPAAADTTGDPRMERMTVIGHARAFYRQVRDSTATDRPSRSYMIGSRIVLFFAGGEVTFVRGQNAIGVFLEPDEAVPVEAGGTAGRAAPVVPDSAARRDSLAMPADTLGVPPDTTGAPPDTTAERRSTVDRPGSIAVRAPDTVMSPQGRGPAAIERPWRRR